MSMSLDGACFLRLALPTRVITYALGMSLWRVVRNPLDAAGEVDLHNSRPSARIARQDRPRTRSALTTLKNGK